MKYAGIDIGSRTIELVVVEDGNILVTQQADTGFDPMALNGEGAVRKFEMNDRCAAGTGKFLEIMGRTLGFGQAEFGFEALKAEKELHTNSMCTVFAESEVTSIVARGEVRRAIALGLHQSVVRRSVGMIKRVSLETPIVFASGVAKNPCMRRLLEAALKQEVLVPEDPQMVGALGAALLSARTAT